MEAGWTILGGSVITFLGFAFNQIITKKIDDLETKHKELAQLVFKRMDEMRLETAVLYLRKDIYEEKHNALHTKIDDKYEVLLEKIEELKKLIAEIPNKLK